MNFFASLLNASPGAITQGMLWGIMAVGVYLTYRILDVADLTVDGSLATGGAVCVVMIRMGVNPWIALICAFLAGMLAGCVTGLLHTRCGIPAILAGILTQLALYSINLRIMSGKANLPAKSGQRVKAIQLTLSLLSQAPLCEVAFSVLSFFFFVNAVLVMF